nr:reverse transcriptase domain-containing protein [Tanacetum cinerariifolium]
MAAPIISISFDSSEESVGSHATRVIHFGTIPAIISVIPEVHITPFDSIVTPEVEAISVISPTGLLDFVDYSSFSDSDPSKDSLPEAPDLPLVSSFLCYDDSEVDSESEPTEQRPERHESLTPSSEFPLAPVVSLPGIRRWPTIFVQTGEAIPFGRPYRTHPNGPRKLLTARKRVRPFLACRLTWTRVSHRASDRHSSPDFTLDSSCSSSSLNSSLDISSGSSLDSLLDSSSVHSSGQSHSGPSTRVASPRLVDLPFRTPRCSKAFMHWRSASLSTLYPPTTSESSLDSYFERSLDLSSPSAGPLRFKDSYSSKISGEEHIEIGTADAETVADLGISEEDRAHIEDGIDLGVELATSDIREDEEKFEAKSSEGGTSKITVDLLATGDIFEPIGGDAPDLEERASLADRVRSLGWENLRVRALLCIKIDRVDSLRRHMALSQEEFCQVRRDRDDTRRRLRRLESLVERRLRFHPNYHAVIVYDEKIVWISYGDEVLIVHGDRNGKGKKSNLSIISCTKTQKYIKKGFLIFLAQVMRKETEEKLEEKRLEDVPTIRDFS